MARLIDKDVLEDAVQGAINIMLEHGISMIAASVPLGIIRAAPTIDAIPVEWLEAHKMECIDDWGVVPISIGRALIMWKKEQEVRGT